jgi:hypothetical protein
MEARLTCRICEKPFTQSPRSTLTRTPSIALTFGRVFFAASFEAMYSGSSTKPAPEELSLLYEYEDQVRFATSDLLEMSTKGQSL